MNLPIIESQNVRRPKRSRFGFRGWMALPSDPIFATVLSLSLLIGVVPGYAAFAATTKAKHKTARAKVATPAPAVQAAAVKVVPPQAILPPDRIHNMMLPVPTITERLIRDIMVGKPQELAPPAGTEAFSNEEPPAANGQAAPAPSTETAPPQPASDATSAPSMPSAETPPASDAAATPSMPSAETPPASDAATTPSTPSAETAPASDAPAGMAPDAVVPLKPEVKQEETAKPQEKSALPLNRKAIEIAFDAQGVGADNRSSLPSFGGALVVAALGQAQPDNSPRQECAPPSLHKLLGDIQAPLPVAPQGSYLSSKSSSNSVASLPSGTTANPEDSSEQLDSAGISAPASTPVLERASQVTTLPLAEPARERIAPDGLEGATYAIKTNSGFGSSMVSRQSIPIETAIQPVTNNGASNRTAEGEEVDLDSAVAPAGSSGETTAGQAAPESSQPASQPAPGGADLSSGEETVMDAATSNDSKAEFKTTVNLGLPSGSILGGVEKERQTTEDGVVVVDNDEAVETQETIQYRELPTDDGKTHVLIGSKFPVVMSSEITSKTAKKGDAIEARLKYDLKIGDRLIAKKGAVVYGHLNYCLKARSAMHSLVSPERWYRNSGCIGVSFDEVINDKGEHLPLVAMPAQTARIIKNKGEGRELGVNHAGQVAGPWSQQLRYKAFRIGLNAALAPAGVFSFGAAPVALGVIGAANPSFAFMKPVGLNVRHRRIKGFAWGFLSGIPGSWLIEDTVIKGQEAVIKPGDEFLCEFKQTFNGEPATDASLIAGASAKVHGQVMPENNASTGQ